MSDATTSRSWVGPQRADRRVSTSRRRSADDRARTSRDRRRRLRDRGDRAGVRASTTSYIASMLRPEIVADLGLAAGCGWSRASPGSRSCSRTPGCCRGGRRTNARRGDPADLGQRRRVRPRDRTAARARPLAPAVLPRGAAEPVRDRLEQAARGAATVPPVPAPVGRSALGSGAVRDRLARGVRRTALRVRRGATAYLANNVYGMHAPPYRPGTAIGLLFHMLSGGEHHIQGFNGHVIGGMGSITGDGLGRPRCRRRDPHGTRPRIDVRDGRATGSRSRTEPRSRPAPVSNADPKRTFLGLVEKSQLPRTSGPTSRRSRWPVRARR